MAPLRRAALAGIPFCTVGVVTIALLGSRHKYF